MASLSDQRKAIQAGMQASRASTIKRDLNSLESSKRKSGELRALEQPGARPATRSAGATRAEPARTTSGGIASPVAESDYSAREWWPAGVPSTDGLLMLPAEKKIVMTDANGAEVIFEYAEPTA